MCNQVFYEEDWSMLSNLGDDVSGREDYLTPNWISIHNYQYGEEALYNTLEHFNT